MEHLSIDIETYSSEDIKKVGLYKYAQSDDFEVLLFAYKIDNAPTQIIDLAQGEHIPLDIILALGDRRVTKHAYNAAFEYYCLNRAGYPTHISQWEDTMAHGMYLSYPAGLEAIGKAIGIPQDKQKLSVGKRLIDYFCKPCKPTKSNGGRTRNLPKHDQEKWELFKTYCKQDVEAEYTIQQRLNIFPMPKDEIDMWRFDVRMNEYGIRVDKDLVDSVLKIVDENNYQLMEEAKRITELDNPNSGPQLLKWLKDQGLTLQDLTKDTVKSILEEADLPLKARRVLEIRQLLAKTSLKKYDTIKAAMGTGDRVRGVSQYYGATRTGRYAGRLVQMQNLPRTYIKDLDSARTITKMGSYDIMSLVYKDVPDTLSQLIRTAFIASEGGKFVVADFSAIEARVIAWLAGEEWVNEVFATHGKIYEATASQMFNVPIETIAKGRENYSLRAKGKVATLALGYQGGVAALKAMGAEREGLTEEEMEDIKVKWRSSNPHIVSLWYELERAAIEAVRTAEPQMIKGLTLRLETDLIYGQQYLTIELPSKRKLYYCRPHIKVNKLDREALHFYGLNMSKKWAEESTYGGKLVENVVQAIARDCLVEVMRRIEKEGWRIVFHVHDEVIVDAPPELTVEHLCEIMARPIEWAPGLVLRGAGFEDTYYKKD